MEKTLQYLLVKLSRNRITDAFRAMFPSLYNLERHIFSLTLKLPVQRLLHLIKTTRSSALTSQNWESTFEVQAIKSLLPSIAAFASFCGRRCSAPRRMTAAACRQCVRWLQALGLFRSGRVSLKASKWEIHFGMVCFSTSFLVTLSSLPTFEGSSVSVLEEPDNRDATACVWTPGRARTGCLRCTLVPLQRVGGKRADKSIFLFV